METHESAVVVEGQEMFTKAVRNDFTAAFRDMRYIDVNAAYGGYPVACIAFLPKGEYPADAHVFVACFAISGARESDLYVGFINGDLEISYNPAEGESTFLSQFMDMRILCNKIKTNPFRRIYPVPKGLDIEHADVSFDGGVLRVALKKSGVDHRTKIEITKTVAIMENNNKQLELPFGGEEPANEPSIITPLLENQESDI